MQRISDAGRHVAAKPPPGSAALARSDNCGSPSPRSLCMIVAVFIATLLLPRVVHSAAAEPPKQAALQLEAKIPLGEVRGRIDHMAVDLKRQRLFVAELDHDAVAVVDLADRKLLRTITGLKEPQGIGYEASSDILYVANARDGSVVLLEGNDYKTVGRIALGSAADNVRVDAEGRRVFVGYGRSAVAVIDPSTRNKVGDIPLKGRPESFQLDPDTSQVFVNVPDTHSISVVDRVAFNQIDNWRIYGQRDNIPMALDYARRQVLVVFRTPAELGVFSMARGNAVTSVETCKDADDVFVDAKRSRVYVSCGAGSVDVFETTKGAAYRRIGRIATVSGARTSLFVPELDQLLVAARSNPGSPAAIWVLKPMP